MMYGCLRSRVELEWAVSRLDLEDEYVTQD